MGKNKMSFDENKMFINSTRIFICRRSKNKMKQKCVSCESNKKLRVLLQKGNKL